MQQHEETMVPTISQATRLLQGALPPSLHGPKRWTGEMDGRIYQILSHMDMRF